MTHHQGTKQDSNLFQASTQSQHTESDHTKLSEMTTATRTRQHSSGSSDILLQSGAASSVKAPQGMARQRQQYEQQSTARLCSGGYDIMRVCSTPQPCTAALVMTE